MLYRKSYKYHMQNIPEKILNPYNRYLKQQIFDLQVIN